MRQKLQINKEEHCTEKWTSSSLILSSNEFPYYLALGLD